MPDATPSAKPSKPKQGEQQQPPWKEHRRPDGSRALDFGKGPIDQKTLDHLCERVKREYRGKPLDIKAAKLKELIEMCNDGDNSALALQGGGRGEPNYMEQFASKSGSIPKSFDEFVPQSLKQEGDHIIEVAQKVGYPIESYSVGKSGEYADMLREGANKIVYHQYADFAEHGEELIRRLAKVGVDVPYDVVPVATTTAWKEGWQKDPGTKIEQIGDKKFGRSMQYAIAFSPEEKSQVKKLVDFFKRNTNAKSKDAVQHSWKTPDVRSSMDEPPDEFVQVVLNSKSSTGYDLMILNKEPIEGFKPSPIFVNRELSKFAKALSILWIAPVRLPLIVSLARKAIPLRKLVYENGFLVAKAERPSFGVTFKAFPYHRGRPGQVGGSTPDPQTEKQRDVHRVMREEQSRGRTPLMSEEAREQNTKRLREMRQLLQTGDWGDISRVLTSYGIQQGSPEWTLAEEAFREHKRRWPS